MKKVFLFVLVLALCFSVVACANTEQPKSSPSIEETTSPSIDDASSPEATSTPLSDEEIKERAKNSQEFNYEELVRNPEEYVGIDLTFFGEIKRVQANGTAQSFSIEKQLEGGRGRIKVNYTPRDGEARYLEEDEVFVYGVFTGSFTPSNEPIFDAWAISLATTVPAAAAVEEPVAIEKPSVAEPSDNVDSGSNSALVVNDSNYEAFIGEYKKSLTTLPDTMKLSISEVAGDNGGVNYAYTYNGNDMTTRMAFTADGLVVMGLTTQGKDEAYAYLLGSSAVILTMNDSVSSISEAHKIVDEMLQELTVDPSTPVKRTIDGINYSLTSGNGKLIIFGLSM